MKSMVQEGSSIAKAIDRAWSTAGKPNEFTIKVMQVEERNFFGLVKKPAVISIIYEPRNNQESKPSRANRPEARVQSRTRGEDFRRQQLQHADSQDRKDNARNTRDVVSQAKGQAPTASQKQQRPVRNAQHDETLESWNEAYTALIEMWLVEILGNMNIDALFSVSIDGQLLKVQFANAVLDSAEEERLLFSSLVSLLMQFLRHKERKRLNGLRVGIYANR